MKLTDELMALADPAYAVFQAKLAPNIDPDSVIGVRVPELRKLAKRYFNTPEADEFMASLPHRYYDENMLHAALITEIKDFDKAVERLTVFLPYVDNWAVCDTLKPKGFAKNKDRLIHKIYEWSASSEEYTCRFGIEMLMNHFLDADFKPEYLELPAKVVTDEYYMKMMLAWFFATALAKQWDATIPYIEGNRLSVWVHNKTIQKARESYRITAEQKEYLSSKKREKKK